jgi:probable phosphoglycerate mutase
MEVSCMQTGLFNLLIVFARTGLIDPKNLCTVLVSPRQRAHKTFHLLFGHVKTPDHIVTEDVREWDYGDYEGLLSSEIKAMNPTWSIWQDG